MPQKKLLYPLFNLHLKRLSWSSSVTLQKHENKCSRHNVISIPMFLMYNSNKHYLFSFQASFSFIALQNKTNQQPRLYFIFLSLNISTITTLPSILENPKHTETEEQDI